MKIKHLILTIVALVACANMTMASLKSDTITLAETGVTSTSTRGEAFDGKKTTNGSGNTYSGRLQNSGTDMNMKFSTSSRILNTSKNGTISSIKVKWADNVSNELTLEIRGGSEQFANPITGNTAADAEIKYTQAGYSESVDLSDYEFSYIYFSVNMAAVIEEIIVVWDVWESNPITATYNSYEGLVELSHTEATKGTEVTVTVTPAYYEDGDDVTEYEIVKVMAGSKELTDPVFDEENWAYIYTFTMGTQPVNVTATFRVIPDRQPNGISYSDITTFTSGAKTNCVFTMTAGAEYDGTVKVTSSNTSVLKVVSCSNTGFTLQAYNRGTATITIEAPQTDLWEGTKNSIKMTVEPRKVVLMTKYNGEGYALVNDIDVAGKMAAAKVMTTDGGEVLLLDDKYTEEAVYWYVCTKSDGTFTIQDASKKYLGYSANSAATMTLTASSYSWSKYVGDNGEDRFFYYNNEIVYNSLIGKFSAYGYDKHDDNAAYSCGAYEASDVMIGKPQTIRTDLTAGVFSTMCLPYSFVTAEGLSIYNMDNVEDEGENWHFYFCRLDSDAVSVAGQPYIIKSTTNTAKVYKIGDENAAAGNYRGLYGTMSNLAWSTVWGSHPYELGNVLVINASGEIKYANGNGGVYGGRAYLLLDEIPTTSDCVDDPAAAPRRERMSIGSTQTPTDVEKIQSAETINWDEPVYNVMGQLVGRGAEGVLIQNGQKYLAQ